jgi:nucleotide-binding universal stress UspA family protein
LFKKIIVGVDFSDISERAANAAVALARAIGAEVVLVHVIAPGADYTDPARFVSEVRPAIEDQIKDLATRAAGATGVKVDWGVVDGKPAEEVATFASRWGGDLIVSGTAGRGGVSRMLLGSVAERLVRVAKCPVLIVGPESTA